ncbi:MAG: hypothetical protein M3N53_13145 [Actinomycetota bacterium]|nr:hypothetical protein [Actinomycetota bacterium]
MGHTGEVGPVKDLKEFAAFWDNIIDRYIAGEFPLDAPLDAWFDSYKGIGEGAVDPQVMPEPYLGDLFAGEHKIVFMGLNPGAPRPTAQARNGTYANEIRALGSYTAWAATWPYLREADITDWGKNVFHDARYRFMKDWYADDNLEHRRMVNWELYPWHSKKIQGSRMRPPPKVVREFVWEPIASLGTTWIFAFGAPWYEQLEHLGLRQLMHLGHGGEPYPTETKPKAYRQVKVYEGPADSFVIAMSTASAAAPPKRREVEILKTELASRGLPVPQP